GRGGLPPAAALLVAAGVGLAASVGAGAQESASAVTLRIPLTALDSVPAHTPGSTAKAEPALPAEATTHHAVTLTDRSLSFTVKAGAAVLDDPRGAAAAEIGYFAYLLDGGEPRTRPIAFVINGGPGSASAWLHIGALGPWRLPIAQAFAHPTASADLLPNPDT